MVRTDALLGGTAGQREAYVIKRRTAQPNTGKTENTAAENCGLADGVSGCQGEKEKLPEETVRKDEITYLEGCMPGRKAVAAGMNDMGGIKSYPWNTEEEEDYRSGFRTDKGTFAMEKKKLSYVPAKDLVKIARAANRQLLKKTISGIQAQIYQLKTGGGERKVRSVLVKQAQQVLQKARIKDKLLKKEELLSLQQKKAAQKAEFEKSMQLKLLLKRKRESRKVREYGQIRDYYETPGEDRGGKQQEHWEALNYAAAVPGGSWTEAYSDSTVAEIAGTGTAGNMLDITV